MGWADWAHRNNDHPVPVVQAPKKDEGKVYHCDNCDDLTSKIFVIIKIDSFLCEPCVELYWRYGLTKDTLGDNFVGNHLRLRNKHDQARMNRFKHLESLVLGKDLVHQVAMLGLPEEDRICKEIILETEDKQETESLIGACSLEKSSESSSKDSDEGYDSKKHSPNSNEIDEGEPIIPSGKLIELCIDELKKKPLISSYVKCTRLKLITSEDVKKAEEEANEENKENEPKEKKFGTPSNLEALPKDIPVPPRKMETPLQTVQVAPRAFTPRRKLEFEANR